MIGSFIRYLVDSPARRAGLLATPACVFLFLFLVLPLQGVAFLSFLRTESYELIYDLGFQNYRTILSSWSYVKPLFRSLGMASIVSLSALLLGWPVAYYIAKRGGKYRLILVLLTAAPFLVGAILRITALQILLAPAGVLEQGFAAVGIEVPAGLMYSDFGTFLGLLYLWLPFVVLAIYLSLLKFNFKLEMAAAVCGSGRLRTFWDVIFPLNGAGTLVGLAFVFIPVLGASSTPRFLGGPDGVMFGMVMENQVEFGTWARGAALAFVLLALSLSALALVLSALGKTELRLMEEEPEVEEEESGEMK